MTPTAAQHRKPADVIVDDLGTQILSGAVDPGEQLGVEKVLCDQYAVSRTVIREALQALAAKGLIVSRPRLGSVVNPVELWNFLDTDVIRWTQQLGPKCNFYSALLEARKVIEPQIASSAATRATPEDIAKMEAALLAMEAATDINDKEAYHEADIAFHLTILQANHNVVISRFGALLRAVMDASFRLAIREQAISKKGIVLHRQVFEAIRDRDPGAAREALDSIAHLLESHLSEESANQAD